MMGGEKQEGEMRTSPSETLQPPHPRADHEYHFNYLTNMDELHEDGREHRNVKIVNVHGISLPLRNSFILFKTKNQEKKNRLLLESFSSPL